MRCLEVTMVQYRCTLHLVSPSRAGVCGCVFFLRLCAKVIQDVHMFFFYLLMCNQELYLMSFVCVCIPIAACICIGHVVLAHE